MVGKLKTLGADVHQVGADWASADRWMREELLAKDFNGVYVPPFDHPDIWEGAATIVPELAEQIGSFDGVVCSIGGGGLFNGIMEGLERGPNKTGPRIKVLAMETIGAHSLAASVDAGEHITLPKITSIATSLGAVRVSEKTWQWAQSPAVTCLALEDKDAASACVRFADDERIIVEVACGISIAPCYNGELRRAFGAGLDDMEWARQKVVIIVCGGSNVTLQVLERYRETYGI
jgi:L-serine/L-threonine ammonia-lyase